MGKRAFGESTIPSSIKKHLTSLVESLPHSRLLLFRPHGPVEGVAARFRIVVGREQDPFYYAFQLRSYEDLLDLEVLPLLEGRGRHRDKISRAPFYLVCTNGLRDPCCAEHGLRAFRTLAELDPDKVWECSHVGGHRFAANVLVFPPAIYYGRVGENEARGLYMASEDGQVLLDHVRGRACYDPPTQAAEALLRRKTGITDWAAFRALDSEEVEPGRWSVRFEERARRSVHHDILEREVSSEEYDVSCRSGKAAPRITYHLLSYHEGH
jgi:hypothetical protein